CAAKERNYSKPFSTAQLALTQIPPQHQAIPLPLPPNPLIGFGDFFYERMKFFLPGRRAPSDQA
ncbi:MAG TPA: hypothetical protein VNT00_01430, partial [Eoetvoesiella sp.]|uniref:hypothetical protein n=1 Tax=Eoetvoesiella sp. TaxID=1966355 RepID=UPI002BDE9018